MELQKKSFGLPDEVRPMADKGRVELVKVGGGVVGRATFDPGWRWSEHVKPIAGTESCQAAHFGYVVSGRQMVRMDDGTELEFGAGDVVAIPPGHDGWVVGDEPCVDLPPYRLTLGGPEETPDCPEGIRTATDLGSVPRLRRPGEGRLTGEGSTHAAELSVRERVLAVASHQLQKRAWATRA